MPARRRCAAAAAARGPGRRSPARGLRHRVATRTAPTPPGTGGRREPAVTRGQAAAPMTRSGMAATLVGCWHPGRVSRTDGRYAPSPTGPLHLGNLRTALLAWCFARSRSARFLLRIEDLDAQRSRPEHEAAMLADLARLGIDWDGVPT